MKQKKLTCLIALFAMPFAFAAEEHDHDHDHDHSKETKEEQHKHEEHVTQGPNGGHVVKSAAGFAFEITVDKERKARIVFLDKDFKAVELGAQTITGISGERSAPVKLTFAKGVDADANVLISDNALSAGDHIAMILTIKADADAKPTVERFEMHLH